MGGRGVGAWFLLVTLVWATAGHGRVAAQERSGIDGVVRGVVVDGASRRPVPNAVVQTRSGTSVLTDEDGRFRVRVATTDAVDSLSVSALGYEPRDVEAGFGGEGALTVELVRAPISLAEIVVAPGSVGILDEGRLSSPITVSRARIEATPQVGDDPFRTLKRLPGVASDDISTRLNVRGASDRDLRYLLDGLEIHEPYHLRDLEGALGIVDVQALGGMEMAVGGYPVELGGKGAGILSMRTRKAPPERRRTTVGFSLTNLSLVSEGRSSGGTGQWLVSARRGFLEYALKAAGVDDEIFPTYWDVLAKGQLLLGGRHLVSLHALGAGDGLSWNDQETDGHLRSRWADRYAWVNWKADWSDAVRSEMVASLGRLSRDREGSVGAAGRDEFAPAAATVTEEADFALVRVRGTVHLQVDPDVRLSAGVDAAYDLGDYLYLSDVVSSQGGGVELPHRRILEGEPGGDLLGLFASVRGKRGPAALETGLRLDHTDAGASASPRVALRWQATHGTTLQGSVGRYVQPRRIFELSVSDGETEVGAPQKTDLVALGVHTDALAGVELGLEAYRRWVRDPLPTFGNLSGEVNPLPEVSADRVRIAGDRARAAGLEVVLTRDRGGAWAWGGSYALSRTEERVAGDWIPRTFDQRHALNVFATLRAGQGWRVSGQWHLRSGRPFTGQTLTVVEDAAGDSQVERVFAALNGERLPVYHRLDLRVTRVLEVGRGRLELFADVLNVYNRQNVRGFAYLPGADASEVRRVPGEEMLPLLPSLGFRWSF